MDAQTVRVPKLGKRPATPSRVRPMRELLGIRDRASIPPPVPASCDWSSHVRSWPMLGNDEVGDCTIAAVGHIVQLLTTCAGDPRIMTTDEAYSDYEAFGWNGIIGDPSDQGANLQDVLTRWTGRGFQIGGQSDLLTGFSQINPADDYEVRFGIYKLGAIDIGVALPLAVQGADSWDCGPLEPNGAPADGPWAYGSWGGHSVCVVGYSPKGLLCITWGKTLWMTWPFFRTYCDEAYVPLSRDFVNASIPDETWAALEQDMADLRAIAV